MTLLLVAEPPSLQGEEPSQVLSFRVRPGAKPETLQKIAELTKASEIQVTEAQTVQRLLRTVYGNSHEDLQELFEKYNDGLTNATLLPVGSTVTLPAAPEWHFDAVLQRRKELSLSNQVLLHMGVAGPKTKNKIAEINDEPFAKLAASPADTLIKIPYSSPVKSEEILPEQMENIKVVLEELRKDPAVDFVEVAPPMQIVPPWSDAVAAGQPCAYSAPVNAVVAPVLSLPSIKNLPLTKATVAILDTGVIVGDARFKFWHNALESLNGRDDEDTNSLVDDIIGYDFVNRDGDPADDFTEPSRMYHGTHVAGVVSQRLSDATVLQEIDPRLDLMILKVAGTNGKVYPEAMFNAVTYAADASVRVMNMSFDTREQYALQWIMKNAPSILFVAAAGNAHDGAGPWDVDAEEIYPAKLAKALPNVISVAAHDAARKIACFSNFGSTTIDVAAPGVWVNSTAENGTTRAMSGSSQAAPLVAYLAAILVTSGMKDASAIRNRIVDSVDFAPELKGKVKAEGVVNGEKALLYKEDLVVKTDGTLLRGRLKAPNVLSLGGGQEVVDIANVRKIVPHYDTSGRARVSVDVDGKREFKVATLNLNLLTLEVAGAEINVPMVDVADVVLAIR
ncbi:MAG TPA: S8 family serine peptidase [Thermoanaerobaculia bacterium]|nr:S8 family serine peptidase [Thermoanaerobaculia bacterium]